MYIGYKSFHALTSNYPNIRQMASNKEKKEEAKFTSKRAGDKFQRGPLHNLFLR